MLGSGHLNSGLDVAAGTLTLIVVGGAGLVLAALFVGAWLALRRMGAGRVTGTLAACAFIAIAGVFAYAVLDRSIVNERAAERRAVEVRAAELTARAVVPGSALACLDELASSVIENACEKPLFAGPEAVASAIAYVDARISLLAASTAVARNDAGYQPAVERLRRAIEADRFGLVAHVLATRGCGGPDCPELRLLRDPSHVVANMKAHTFDSELGTHALAWTSSGAGGGAVAAGSPPVVPSLPAGVAGMPNPDLTATSPTAPALSQTGAPTAPGAQGSVKFDYPSASSIPPVSIMSAEPTGPPTAEPKSAPAPKRPPARKQAAPRAAPAAPSAAPPAPAPVPPPPAETSGSR